MIQTSALAWTNKPSAVGAVSTVAINFAADILWRVGTNGALFDKTIYAQLVTVDNTLNPNNVTVTINNVLTMIAASTRLNLSFPSGTLFMDLTSPNGITTLNFYENANDAPPDQPNYGALIVQTIAATTMTTGNCRLDIAGGNVVLTPFNGTSIRINQLTQTIPAVGVTLVPGGLIANTTYYIYAFMNPAMTLEASVTNHVTAVDGTEVKNGDPSRALVGMARTIAGPLWVDSLAQRFCISWFNRRALQTYRQYSIDRNYALGAFSELNAEIESQWLTWANQPVHLTANYTGSNAGGGGNWQGIATFVDGVNQNDFCPVTEWGIGAFLAFSLNFCGVYAEGYHMSSPQVYCNTGNSTWWATVGRCKSQAIIQG